MKHIFRALLAVIPIILLVSAPVAAARHITSSTTGNDVSWPQCGKHLSLPSGQAFGIVGVNGGLANDSNSCFTQELSWAEGSSGITNQPKAALYVNTGNPGDVTPTVADWPTNDNDVVSSGVTDSNPDGTCTGLDDIACSWQYGYNMANLDYNTRGVVAGNSYSWYLDVETGNSWTSSTAKNQADLEGMVAYLESVGVTTIGVYSTTYQWGQIVGSVDSSSSLYGLPSWLPGARSYSAAQANCQSTPLTPTSKVVLTQYVSRNTDYDFSCI